MTSTPSTTTTTEGPSDPFDLLVHAALGRGITRGGLTFIPIYLPGQSGGGSSTTVQTGDNAQLVIQEVEQQRVPTVTVTNSGESPALLVEGETIRGGLQQRVVNTTILIPAGQTVEVPVSCIEAGRWGGGRSFAKGDSYAPTRVRRAKQWSVAANVESHGHPMSDQHAIWAGVSEVLHERKVSSSTSNAADADLLFETDQGLSRALRSLTRRGPLPGQVGVVVLHGRRPVALELFSTPELLREHWTAIVRSHLIDAVAEPEGSPSLDRAMRFLQRIRKSRQVTAEGVGLGTEHHLRSDRVSGQALTWEGAIVHASAFALAA